MPLHSADLSSLNAHFRVTDYLSKWIGCLNPSALLVTYLQVHDLSCESECAKLACTTRGNAGELQDVTIVLKNHVRTISSISSKA